MGDLEIIVVDDGSTDTSLAIAQDRAEADQRVTVASQPNGGVSSALNKAAGLARSDLIARLDADDVCEPERLEKQLAFLDTHPEVVCCGSAISYINEDGKKLRYRQFPLDNHTIQRRILQRGCYAHSTVIYRRAAFEAVGRYRSNFDSAEDLDLFLRLSEVGEMANLPHRLVQYRLHGNQTTAKPSPEHRLKAFLATASAINRRMNKEELLPETGTYVALAIAFIEDWLESQHIPWTRHTASAMHALSSLMESNAYKQLRRRLYRKLLAQGDIYSIIEIYVMQLKTKTA